MRLIDVDAIHISITGGRMNGKVEFAKAIEEAIKEAPTIEAITVEWIDHYREKCLAIEDDAIREMVQAWRGEQC